MLKGEVSGVEVVCVVLASLVRDTSEAPAEGEGLRDGDVRVEDTGGAVDITVAVLVVRVPVVPENEAYLYIGIFF